MADTREMPDSAIAWVLMKWVALRPEVDALAGTVRVDDRFSGASPADHAALELALGYSQRFGKTVSVITVGPPEAEAMLRAAIACGASNAVRIDPHLGADEQASSASVATAIAAHLHDVAMVFCGDWSLDRGSASVPSYVANLLDLDQACGVVAMENVDPSVDTGAGIDMRAYRRLDGGRREVLAINGPAVVSVEGSAATLRRAPLAGVLRSQQAVIPVVTHPLSSAQPGTRLERVSPHRPPSPHLSLNSDIDPRVRVSDILGVGVERTPPMRLVLDPNAAADIIIERLESWGQIPRA